MARVVAVVANLTWLTSPLEGWAEGWLAVLLEGQVRVLFEAP